MIERRDLEDRKRRGEFLQRNIKRICVQNRVFIASIWGIFQHLTQQG